MPEFILDHGTPAGAATFKSLDSFTQGYVEAMFFTECNSDNPELEYATVADLAPETLARIIADCNAFNLAADVWLNKAYQRDSVYTMERAGHDFWLTRNRHGAGFWDRGLGAAGDELTKHAHSFGSCDLYRGDDSLLYLS